MKRLSRLVAAAIGIAVLPVFLGGAVSAAQADTLYVSNENPVGDGSSCAQPAYDDPQAAIDASADGDTVFLCAGTYPGGYDLDASEASTNLYIEGAGTGSTVVDGATATPANPQLFFDSNPGGLETVHFSGVTFENGLALDDDGAARDGGGGAIGLSGDGVGSDVVVTSSLFDTNVTQGSGGAVAGIDVTVTDSTFTTNRADLGVGSNQDRGGAIKAAGDLLVTDSTFTSNVGYDQGGAISAEGTVTVRSSAFTMNESGWDGGAIFAPSDLILTSSTFTGNVANDSGGAVWASGTACVDYFESPCPVAPEGYSGVGTTFTNNTTEGNNNNGQGGGLYSASLLYMNGATFTGNSATDSDPGGGTPSPDGGALFNAGTAVVSDTTFASNTAVRFGGAIGSSSGSLILDSTVVNGNSNTGDGGGGGIWSDLANLTVIDSTISSNSSTSLGGGIQFAGGDLLIDGSTFVGNESENVGGAVFVFESPVANVLDSTFTENEAANGGGALLADGVDLTVDESTFNSNQSGSGVDWPGGGAIAGNQETTVTDSTFTDNRAIEPGSAADGGAIAAPDSGPGSKIEVLGSTFTGNEADGLGGAIASYEPVDMLDSPTVLLGGSTIADSDETQVAGGIAAFQGSVFALDSTFTGIDSNCLPVGLGEVFLLGNSTVTGNSGGSGEDCGGLQGTFGAIGLLGVVNATLSGNATSGLINSPGGDYVVANSIIDHAGNGCVLEGTPDGIGGNVVTDRTTGCDPLVGGPPPSLQGKVSVSQLGLGPLADNGGPTETMAIGPGSAAIGAGFAEGDGVPCLPRDQRGVERLEGECDSGAFEYVSFDLSVTKGGSGSGSVTSDPAGIECGSTCSSPFAANTTVTLTARPGSDSRFRGWSGAGCSGTGPCQVTMSQARLVDATFTAKNAGVKIAPATKKTVKVRSAKGKIGVARVTCVRQGCTIRKARAEVRIGARTYRAKVSFPKTRFPAGKSRVVSVMVPRAAFARLGKRPGVARVRVVAVSEDRTRAQRGVQVRLRR